MAKKKKQKKAGLAKRQAGKQVKKRAVKRKVVSQRPAEKKQMKMSRVKKNLKKLPNLIFESELQEIAFTQEQVQGVMEAHEKTPDQIEAIATPEFMEKLGVQLQTMDQRFALEQDADRGMMVKAMLYFMDQEQAPTYLNQLIVSLFYQALHKIETPEADFGPIELELQIKDYDEKWESYLEEKTAALQEQGEGAETPAFPQEEVEEEAWTASPFEQLLEEFGSYLSSELKMEEEVLEKTQEDAEALFNDYFEEKEITSLEGIRVRKIQNFLEGWFIRNMNPTPEDVESMIGSLSTLVGFLESKEKIAADKCQAIVEYLGNKEAILANL
ncbi:MAG: hypothetical protein COB67_12700 [SAR324 cluster bacterium]|uniref:Uncharacterized protein n=1 Tax=SAR324 cluster bacterium TaxID=2024889 RepID=A0A2A4SQ33_9DELT|nr:MAG: hypothetical protein COB67_12700 [SAR324 cluster bacterium]